ncbi:MAG: hypothetical protein ACLFPJ_03465 [Candidatus Woesearchaeota archaeon]
MKIYFIIFLFLFVLLAGCATQNIEDIKSEEYIGERVSVRGIVEGSVDIGDFSGYLIVDDDEKIGVVSDDIPDEGEEVLVRGTLMRDTIFGYYIRE